MVNITKGTNFIRTIKNKFLVQYNVQGVPFIIQNWAYFQYWGLCVMMRWTVFNYCNCPTSKRRRQKVKISQD